MPSEEKKNNEKKKKQLESLKNWLPIKTMNEGGRSHLE